MAATREQGSSLAVLLTGFTALPAGLVVRAAHPALGTMVALAGGALFVGSLVWTWKLRPLEFAEDKGGK